MKLKRNERWNIPFDCPFYPPLPAHLVFFRAEARAIDHFLPEPLEPSKSGLCVVGGIDVPDSSHYGAFQESLLLFGGLPKKIGTRSAFGSVQMSHSQPTRSVLQLAPSANCRVQPVCFSWISQQHSSWMRALFRV